MEIVILIVSFILGCFFSCKVLKDDKSKANHFDAEKVSLQLKVKELQNIESDFLQLKNDYKNLEVKFANLNFEYNSKAIALKQQYEKRINELATQYSESELFAQYKVLREQLLYKYQSSKEKLFSKIQVKEKSIDDEKSKLYERYQQTENELKRKHLKFIEDIKKKENALESEREQLKKQLILLNTKICEIPVLSKHFADIAEAKENSLYYFLMTKKNPAYKAANIVNQCKQDIRKLRIQNKNLEYKLISYESIFPILKEYDNEPLSAKADIPDYDDVKGDRAHYWLNPTEYKTLSVTERNQLALDRYWNRNKTHAELGADYEKSIGYWEYERNGWEVEYFGIDKGLEDMGRDLICISPDKRTTHIVQCKCWSSRKEIHENHINQLFGTTVRYVIEHTGSRSLEDFVKLLESKTIVPVFYTKTTLSETAKSFAESLGIEVHEGVDLKKYPMIKCNISRKTQERIYHLPFDQQYDNIVIEPPDEFVAFTVDEAEQAGFRRAFKWLGN